MKKETAKCRGCGEKLTGKPYYTGEDAFLRSGERAPVNFYGGFVCSYDCDVRVCLRMSGSMPGAGDASSLNSYERRKVRGNWPDW